MDNFRFQEQQKTAEKLPPMQAKVNLNLQTLSQEEKDLNKLLRRPRTKKFSKALKDVDTPSLEDEALMERMRQEMNISEDEDYTFTPEDMESFRKRIEEKIAEDIAREELQRKAEEVRLNSIMQDIICKCGIPGCIVHSIIPSGSIKAHFTEGDINSMGRNYKLARNIVCSRQEWTYVEIYPKKLVHRSEAGDAIAIYEAEQD